MHLSKRSYYADFVVYPVLIATACLWSLWQIAPHAAERWFAAVCVGMLFWTMIEYVLHRWVLHRMPPFSRLHAMHHEHPTALIGTPTWVSASLFLGLWASLAYGLSVTTAGGLIGGMMTGYLVYVIIHDAVHHRLTRPGSWLHMAKRRHARHHSAGSASNFGVSTSIWDSVLDTSVPVVSVRAENSKS